MYTRVNLASGAWPRSFFGNVLRKTVQIMFHQTFQKATNKRRSFLI